MDLGTIAYVRIDAPYCGVARLCQVVGDVVKVAVFQHIVQVSQRWFDDTGI